jgi:hypothetical protein
MPNRHTFVDPEHSSFHLASCSSPKGLCTTKAASPLGGKPIKDGFGFDPFPESLCANGVMTLSSMNLPALPTNLGHRQKCASDPRFFDVRKSQNRNDSRSQNTCAAAEAYDDRVQALVACAAQSLLARVPVAL